MAIRGLVDLQRNAHTPDGRLWHFASQCGPCQVPYRVDAPTILRWQDSIDVSDDEDTA